MKSKEVGDIYATREPGEAFHERIRACLALHDESVKVCTVFLYSVALTG
jgi:26S proteasome regulatory subunit N3